MGELATPCPRNRSRVVSKHVYLDSPNNSTLFTVCCNVAINDNQRKCPRCHALVMPAEERWRYAYNRAKRHGWGNRP